MPCIDGRARGYNRRMIDSRRSFVLLLATASTLASCAAMPGRAPVQVTVADIESLPSEGLEMRMLVKLRVQNPNDTPIEYDGVYVSMAVQDKTFATGVSDERGVIPRFGEGVVNVPVTVSLARAVTNAFRMFGGGETPERFTYKLEGKLNGPLFGSTYFESRGEIALPGA